MGDLGFAFLAAAISCSWFTTSAIDNLSSGFTFNMESEKGDSNNITETLQSFFSPAEMNNFFSALQFNKQSNAKRMEQLLNLYPKFISITSTHEKIPFRVKNISKNIL